HGAVEDLRRSCQTQRGYFALSERNQLIVACIPQLVALETEVFETEAGFRRLRSHLRTPVFEVLHASELHVRLVDVDPGIGKKVRRVDDERNRQEVAVAQAPRGGEHVGGRRRVQRLHQLTEGD